MGIPAVTSSSRRDGLKFVVPRQRILPSAPEFGEPTRHLDGVGEIVIPPVELHEIEALDPETREGSLDGGGDIRVV